MGRYTCRSELRHIVELLSEIDWKIYHGLLKKRPNPCPDVDLLSTSVFANLRFLGPNPISLLSSPLLSASKTSDSWFYYNI